VQGNGQANRSNCHDIHALETARGLRALAAASGKLRGCSHQLVQARRLFTKCTEMPSQLLWRLKFPMLLAKQPGCHHMHC
jgi:hypothetical protein